MSTLATSLRAWQWWSRCRLGYPPETIRDKITTSPQAGEEVVNMKVRITVQKQGRPPTTVEGTVVAWSQGVERFGGVEFFQVPVCVLSTADGIRCLSLQQYGADIDVMHLDHAAVAA